VNKKIEVEHTKINNKNIVNELFSEATPILDRRIFLTIYTSSLMTTLLLAIICVARIPSTNLKIASILLAILIFTLSYITYLKKKYYISHLFPIVANFFVFFPIIYFKVDDDDFYIICMLVYAFMTSLLLYHHTAKYKLAMDNVKKYMQAKNEEHDEFYANVNHELRTPLHVMMGMNEMIMRESNVPNITEYAINSHKAGDHLQTLINKLLVYSQLGPGKHSPMNVEFSLPIIIDTYTMGFKKSSSQQGINFVINIIPTLPDTLIGDNILLRQVIYNLTTGMFNISDTGTVTSNFFWDRNNDQQGVLHFDISVSDVDITDSDYDNTELDLKTIGDILDIMNGSLKLTRHGETGSQIKVYMPFDTNQHQHISKSTSYEYNTNDADFTASNARILIVDDTEMNIKVFSLLLKRSLIKIDSALNGYDALKLISQNKYHMIFIDYMMPGMNGAELYEQIKQNHPNVIETTPIFAISANTATETRETLLSLGFDGYLPKPIESSQLDYIIKTNLTQDLVDTIEKSISNSGNSHNYENFTNILSNYDIDMSSGLKYMNNDIVQYANVAELIVKNYPKTHTHIESLYAQGNIKDFGISVHALKGNAKYIGATTLYNIAYTLETRSGMNEEKFIELSLPLLYYEWRKVINGLTLFLKDYSQSEYATSNISEYESINTESYLEQLIDYVDDLHPEPAIKLIQKVIDQHIAVEQEDKLQSIIDYLEDFEYERAMDILKEMNL